MYVRERSPQRGTCLGPHAGRPPGSSCCPRNTRSEPRSGPTASFANGEARTWQWERKAANCRRHRKEGLEREDRLETFLTPHTSQGLPSDEESKSGREVREFLARAV